MTSKCSRSIQSADEVHESMEKFDIVARLSVMSTKCSQSLEFLALDDDDLFHNISEIVYGI